MMEANNLRSNFEVKKKGSAADAEGDSTHYIFLGISPTIGRQ
jgi:hypothetical protein